MQQPHFVESKGSWLRPHSRGPEGVGVFSVGVRQHRFKASREQIRIGAEERALAHHAADPVAEKPRDTDAAAGIIRDGACRDFSSVAQRRDLEPEPVARLEAKLCRGAPRMFIANERDADPCGRLAVEIELDATDLTRAGSCQELKKRSAAGQQPVPP